MTTVLFMFYCCSPRISLYNDDSYTLWVSHRVSELAKDRSSRGKKARGQPLDAYHRPPFSGESTTQLLGLNIPPPPGGGATDFVSFFLPK